MKENMLKEAEWKAVTRGQNKGYAINAYAASTSWYNNYLDSSGSRLNRLRRYHEADKCSVEISRALDVIAEDVSSSNADDDFVFKLDYPDESKVNKTTVRLMQKTVEMWADRTCFGEDLFERIRETLKYGATFYLKQSDGTVKKLPTERFVGYVLADGDEDVVTHYVYNPHGVLLDNCGKLMKTTQTAKTAGKTDDYQAIPVSELIVLKNGDTPFGMSIIEPVYRTWRQMSLIEDAVIIYRVVRAPERRVYYIDVGNLQGAKREQAIEKQRLRLMQKNAVKSNQVTTEFDPHSTSEDIFIPTNSTGKGSRIETLQGGTSLGELGDLEWFSKKLAAGLRIPHSMIDSQGGDQQSAYSDMRVGQAYQIEIRYLGYVKRFQRRFARTLFCNFKDFCDRIDVSIPDDLIFRINAPMSFSVYKEMELNQTMLNVFNSTLQISSLSKKFALRKYLGLEHDELQMNETQKLLEMGIAEEDIKDMDQQTIDNLVYGVPKLETAEKYGISAEEQKAGW